MPAIVCLGEALIDMVAQAVGDLAHAPGFEKAPGGAPANVAAGLGILGADVGFIGKVGNDPWGVCLDETLHDCNVDTSQLLKTDDEFTRLAFVALKESGDHDFLFHGNRGADELLRPEDLSLAYIAEAGIFHFGSITTIHEPARAATYEAVRIARDNDLLVSYDPNLRPPLWSSEKDALDQMRPALELVDIVKVNEVEMEFLTGRKEVAEGAKALFDLGPELVTVTLGKDGCYFHHANGRGSAPGFAVDVVDTVGCGDAFVAGVLLCVDEAEEDLGELGQADLERICSFANAAAAITATGNGAIPALPTREEVEELLEGKRHGADDPGW